MSGVRLEWAQFGDFDSFDVIRSDSPMDISALPSPLVSGLPTMYHVDTAVTQGATYYYRVVAWRDGVSKISSEVMVKAQVGDEHWDKVVSLLHFDGNLTDDTGRVWNSTGTTNFSDLDAKFGKSAVFAGSYVQGINDAGFIFNSDDFTVELFVKFSSLPGSNTYSFVGNYYFNDGWVLQYRNDDGLGGRVRFSFGDSNYVDRSWSPTLNTWYHLAVSRNSGLLYIFIDGLQLGATASFAHNITVNGGNSVNIGALKYNSSVLQYFYGSLDELRITKGVARYTENFTPPDAPFLSY